MQNDKLLPATYDVEIAKTPTPDHPIPLDTQMYIKELESRFDRIVEQLEAEKEKANKRAMTENSIHGHTLDFESFYGQRMAYCQAIEIVKGGVDNG